MKKRIVISTMILCLCTVVVLSSCGGSSEGITAYDIAVENGFEGTESEWLETLKGEDGKDGLNGTDGKDGVNGLNGTDGKDSEFCLDDYYRFAVDNGYEGSKLDFLKDFLTVNYSSDPRYTVMENVLSTVSIICAFTVTSYEELSTPLGVIYDYSKPIETTAYSLGSGIFYHINKEKGDAYIITNYHIVYSSEASTEEKISSDIQVYLYGSETRSIVEPEIDQGIAAKFIGGSMMYDIAVLKIEDSETIKDANVCEAKIADSNDVVAGETATAIGNSNGNGLSVTNGIISVDSENISMKGADGVTDCEFRVIRVDCAVNHGNSGGGLFNSEGLLIGIVNAKNVQDEVESIGYALPSNVVKYVVENILDSAEGKSGYGTVSKCLLGVTVRSLNSRAVYDKDSGKTFIVEDITVYESDAVKIKEEALVYGKLQNGDLIREVKIDRTGNGEIDEKYEITRSFMLVDLMLTMRIGDKLTLVIERPGEEDPTKEFTFTMTEGCIDEIK